MSTKNKTPDDLIAAVRNEGRKDLANFIDGVIETITEPPTKIPEVVFRELFLPYIAGEKKATENSPVLAQWFGLIGGASSEASVIDTEGNEVFRVPPVYDTSAIKLGERAGGSLSNIFKEYIDDSKLHHGRASRVMMTALAEKTSATIGERQNDERWDRIRQYYGYGTPGTPAKAAPKAEAPGAADDDGFVVE